MMKLMGWGTANFGFTPYGKRLLIHCQRFEVIASQAIDGELERSYLYVYGANQVHQASPSSDLNSSSK